MSKMSGHSISVCRDADVVHRWHGAVLEDASACRKGEEPLRQRSGTVHPFSSYTRTITEQC